MEEENPDVEWRHLKFVTGVLNYANEVEKHSQKYNIPIPTRDYVKMGALTIYNWILGTSVVVVASKGLEALFQ